MEMQVMAHDKYLTRLDTIVPYVTESTREEIQNQADIISFHLPWSEETHHYCNSEFLKHCKRGVILINTSRGRVIATPDLVDALEAGQVGGACLDVFENEKPDRFTDIEESLYQRLYQMDQVILSPHIAGWTRESKVNMARILLEKILALYR
jgi:D-3-phosphoglycerate dehydrogenase